MTEEQNSEIESFPVREHEAQMIREHRKMNPGMYSSATDNWATPQSTFDELNKEFNFELDVCASKENSKVAKYFTREDDGLKQNWGGGNVLVQPALWARDRKVGGESQRPRLRDASSCANGHALVS